MLLGVQMPGAYSHAGHLRLFSYYFTSNWTE